MGKIGEEITQQIKSAVKAKLIELGIEVDNELPDYIMVLVANKKTQVQMERDLQLFLGPNTTIFTIWLLNVLKKLEEVTVSKRNFKKMEVTNEEGSSGIVITKKEDDADDRKLVRLERIKVEPGCEPSDDSLSTKDPSHEEAPLNESNMSSKRTTSEIGEDESDNQGTNVDDEDEEEEDNDDDDKASAEHEIEDETHHAEEDSSQVNLSSYEHEESKIHTDQGLDSNTNDKTKAGCSKIVYSEITEQIDEVMEKTFNGNKKPRDDHDGSSDDDRSNDNNRFNNDHHQEKTKLSDEKSRRSPNNYDKLRDSRKKSPADTLRKTYERKSPEDRRRSPDDRRRSPIDRRRSPMDRRRNSDYRRRSPYDRRRMPLDRRRSRSPNHTRRSSERRLNDDRRRDANRKSPDDRGRTQILDAREILKRKSRSDNQSPISAGESLGHEKRRKLVSMVQKVVVRGQEKSTEPQIPSLVRVTPRPIRKDAIQPNKKLLLLAVADAEKSISKRPSTQLTTPASRKRGLPKPETKTVKTDERNTSSPSLSYVPPEKIFVTLTNQKSSNDDKGSHNTPREVSTRKVYDESETGLEDEILYEDSYFDYDEEYQETEEYVPTKVTKYVPVKENEKNIQTKSQKSNEAKCIISLESSPERSCDEWDDLPSKVHGTKLPDKEQDMQEIIEEDQFVTSAEKSEDRFEWSRLGPSPIATVKTLSQCREGNEQTKCEALNKALQRCRFWPSCLSGNCIYYHPSVPCKMFPACKSGKECLFIHPDCKFGSSCFNPNCTFLHKSTEDQQKVEAETVIIPSGKASSPLIKCAYFPNCKNLNCKFWHPVKNCKYGRTCARSDCYFFHPSLTIPPKELLTWTSKN